MVTLLLCFFILFFNVHSGIVKVQAKTIPVNEKKQQGNQSLGPQLNTITMQEIGEKFKDLLDVHTNISTLPNVTTVKYSDYFLILLQDVSFFAIGSYQLTKYGESTIDQILQRLQPHAQKIYVEIQGHADKTPVARNKHLKYKDNLELSTLRALTVYSRFARAGFLQETLSISGYGSHRPVKIMGIPDSLPEVLEKNRRISLRVEAR